MRERFDSDELLTPDVPRDDGVADERNAALREAMIGEQAMRLVPGIEGGVLSARGVTGDAIHDEPPEERGGCSIVAHSGSPSSPRDLNAYKG